MDVGKLVGEHESSLRKVPHRSLSTQTGDCALFVHEFPPLHYFFHAAAASREARRPGRVGPVEDPPPAAVREMQDARILLSQELTAGRQPRTPRAI